MKRLLSLGLVLLSVAPALGNPAWKSAPGADEEQKNRGLFYEIDWASWFEWGLTLLGDSWEYFGILFILLVLYLFVRGASGRRKSRVDEEEAFFEEGDAGHY